MPLNRVLLSAIIALVLAGCHTPPHSATNAIYHRRADSAAAILKATPAVAPSDAIKAPDHFVGTTNFSMRRPGFVVIHHTSQRSSDETLETFTTPAKEVSAHYLIGRDGTVHHLLSDFLRAHHAGAGRWGSITDMNSCSIGIELDNNGTEPFPDAQIRSLLSLLGRLQKTYGIPAANFIGHADYAPTRKDDPNIFFPWKKLALAGFGQWYAPICNAAPAGFDHLQGLRLVGYDVHDSTAAIRAFKRHFLQDTLRSMTGRDRAVLYNLVQQY